MVKRYAFLSLFVVMVAVGVARMPGESMGTFEASSNSVDDDAGPWFNDAKKKRSSSIPDQNGGEVRLERDSDSHFYADVQINGRSVRMLVDSGASMIALTRADAEAAGIDVDGLDASGAANTAGGVVPIRPVELDRVRIEGLEVIGVQAAVIDADMPASLLGQSYLSRLQSVKVEGNTMTLR